MHTDTLTQTHTHVRSYAHTHTYTGAVPIVAGEPFAHRMRAWQKLLPIVLDEGDDVGAFPQARLAIYMYLSIYMYIYIYIYMLAPSRRRV